MGKVLIIIGFVLMGLGYANAAETTLFVKKDISIESGSLRTVVWSDSSAESCALRHADYDETKVIGKNSSFSIGSGYLDKAESGYIMEMILISNNDNHRYVLICKITSEETRTSMLRRLHSSKEFDVSSFILK